MMSSCSPCTMSVGIHRLLHTDAWTLKHDTPKINLQPIPRVLRQPQGWTTAKRAAVEHDSVVGNAFCFHEEAESMDSRGVDPPHNVVHRLHVLHDIRNLEETIPWVFNSQYVHTEMLRKLTHPIFNTCKVLGVRMEINDCHPRFRHLKPEERSLHTPSR